MSVGEGARSAAEGLYAPPREVTDPSLCSFYHVMDLPGLGIVGGQWDLRSTVEDYLGRFDFRGRRVLDVGAASGYLSFEVEKRGADVVSFDLDSPDRWEVVPFADPRYSIEAVRARHRQLVPARWNAYWLAHRLLASRNRVFYGDIYALPEALGDFDVVLFGMILGHLRDPFRALAAVAPFARDAIIVTQAAPLVEAAYGYFMPDPATLEPDAAWWSLSEACTSRMLGVLGFTVETVVRAAHVCLARHDRELCSAIVARRRHPRPAPPAVNGTI
jgi:SAM-dependent methyltransferase